MSDPITNNTGVIIEAPSPTDWIAGGATGLAFEQRIAAGDWRPFLKSKERQSSSRYDTMSCVTFSALNSIEAQITWLKEQGLIAPEVIKELTDMGYFDADGHFDASDWFTAVMSGTTPNGNTLPAVWQSIHEHGLLPQRDGFKVQDFKTTAEWLDASRVTQAHKDKALKFLEIFKVNYEWVILGTTNPKVLADHLQHAPVQIATPVCDGWRTDTPVKTCTKNIQHATCAVGSESELVTHILDHYDPMSKQLAWDYPVPYAMKGVLSLVAQPQKPSMILPNTKKTIIINAGHDDNDSGAVHNGIIEREECKKVRDMLVPILTSRGYTVHVVPDNLNLTQSIAFANAKAPALDDGLAIDIHFNSLSNPAARGTETFHGVSETSKQIAAALSKGIADALGIPNRGAKPDTQTHVGSLGWIRKTTMWASLVEICFITNAEDMAVIKGVDGYKKAALGIADGINTIFGVETEPEPQPEPPTPPAECRITDFSDDELIGEVKRRMSA